MDDINYDTMDQNTLTVEITLAEYRYLLRRDFEATIAQNRLQEKDNEITSLIVRGNVLGQNVRNLKREIALIKANTEQEDEKQ